VSLLTHVSRGLFNDPVSMQVGEAARFLRRRDIPLDLQRRVEHCLRCRLRQETQLAVMPTLLSKLSPCMQRELTMELLSSTILAFRMFKGASMGFIAEIAQAHTWVQCIVGDLIVEEGQMEQELVFVVLGQLVMLTSKEPRKEGEERRASSLTPRAAQAMLWASSTSPEETGGAANVGPDSQIQDQDEFTTDVLTVGGWFGEASLFDMKQVRSSTVFAGMDSELAALNGAAYQEIIKRYPTVSRRHDKIEQELQLGRLSLNDLSFFNSKASRGLRRSNAMKGDGPLLSGIVP